MEQRGQVCVSTMEKVASGSVLNLAPGISSPRHWPSEIFTQRSSSPQRIIVGIRMLVEAVWAAAVGGGPT